MAPGTTRILWMLWLLLFSPVFAAEPAPPQSAGPSAGQRDAPSATPATVPSASASPPRAVLVVLIGGIDSDPTSRQIAGTAGRYEGKSGLYRLGQDLKSDGWSTEYFNWNGTPPGDALNPNPPMSAPIVELIRTRRTDDPRLGIVLIGNSWGGHTAWDVCTALNAAPSVPVDLVLWLDPSSLGRVKNGRPGSLPANVSRAVNYFTRHVIGWQAWPDEPRVENVDLGDPRHAFLVPGGPRYDSLFNVRAHIAAEWDERIHEDMRRRIRAAFAAPQTAG